MTPTEYEIFADECCEKLQLLQDKLQDGFNLSFYERWDYKQAAGLFEFSTGEKRIAFRYVAVGTFSTETNTWKWSWDNEHTMTRVKVEMNEVKKFGIENGIEELQTGLLPADEYTGWRFTAIAANLLNATAGYRVPSGHLFVYVILMEPIGLELADELLENVVECDAHKSGWVSFVCQHLNCRSKSGFNEAFESSPGMILEPGNSFQAWCDECEQVRFREGEWNEKSEAFAKIRLVCDSCYFEIKEFNLGETEE